MCGDRCFIAQKYVCGHTGTHRDTQETIISYVAVHPSQRHWWYLLRCTRVCCDTAGFSSNLAGSALSAAEYGAALLFTPGSTGTGSSRTQGKDSRFAPPSSLLLHAIEWLYHPTSILCSLARLCPGQLSLLPTPCPDPNSRGQVLILLLFRPTTGSFYM